MKKFYFLFLILLTASNLSFSQNLKAELNNLNFSGNGNPKYLTEYNNEIIFSANRYNFGNELWKFNPTTSAKTLLKKFINNTFISIKSEFIKFNNKLYFIATDTSEASYQLWVTDGTAAGTIKIQTIANPSYNFGYQIKFKVAGNKLFFKYSNQLWVSDGTTTGTKKIAQFNDINGELCVLNNNVFFTADDGISGYDIWKSDGTNNGTVLLKDINPSNAVGEIVLQPYNNKLYFFATGNLWESDGTEAGTQIFSNVYSNGFKGGVVNGKLVFYTSNYELWSTDGTSGNTILLDTIYNVTNVFTFKDKLYLDTPTNFIETNGTTIGTQTSTSFGSLTTPLDYYSLSSDKNYVIFTQSNQAPYTYYPKYISNGISQNSLLINNSSDENSYLEYAGNIYYSGKKDIYDSELFRFNYSNNNYENATDIDFWQDSKPRAFQTINNEMFFTATDMGNRQQAYKRDKATGLITKLSNFDFEVGDVNKSIKIGNYYYAGAHSTTGFFRTNGSVQNTQFINVGSQTFSGFYKFDDNTMVFRTVGTNSTKIWKINNNSPTPELLRENVDNSFNSYQEINNSVKINNNLYFIFQENGLPAIYKTDGTPNNTSKVSNFSNLTAYSAVDIIGKINDKFVYFVTPDPYSNYCEVWITDGTGNGTLLQTFTQLVRKESFLYNNKLYFFGYKSGFSFLMSTDGTTGGTQVIRQTGNGESSAYNYDEISTGFSFCGNNLFFTNFGYRNSVWKTDGTSVGTIEVTPSSPNYDRFYNSFACAKNYLYFLGQGTDKIWRTDGTIANTQPFSITVMKNGQPDVAENQITGVPLSLMATDGDNLFINSYTAISGWELYSITTDLPTFLQSEEVGIKSYTPTLTLYPNPTIDKLYLKIPFDQKIDKSEIYDLSGKNIKTLNLNENEIDVSDLKTGMYLIKVYIKDKTFSGKFIKK